MQPVVRLNPTWQEVVRERVKNQKAQMDIFNNNFPLIVKKVGDFIAREINSQLPNSNFIYNVSPLDVNFKAVAHEAADLPPLVDWREGKHFYVLGEINPINNKCIELRNAIINRIKKVFKDFNHNGFLTFSTPNNEFELHIKFQTHPVIVQKPDSDEQEFFEDLMALGPVGYLWKLKPDKY